MTPIVSEPSRLAIWAPPDITSLARRRALAATPLTLLPPKLTVPLRPLSVRSGGASVSVGSCQAVSDDSLPSTLTLPGDAAGLALWSL